jgi:multidrug efflux pump
MMFAIEINFWTREVTIGRPTASLWIQLSTAIVFGLAFSKMITLGLVPAMLALPYRVRTTRRDFSWAMRPVIVKSVRQGRRGATVVMHPGE